MNKVFVKDSLRSACLFKTGSEGKKACLLSDADSKQMAYTHFIILRASAEEMHLSW